MASVLRIIERLLRHVHADVALHDRRAGHQLQFAVFRQQRRLFVAWIGKANLADQVTARVLLSPPDAAVMGSSFGPRLPVPIELADLQNPSGSVSLSARCPPGGSDILTIFFSAAGESSLSPDGREKNVNKRREGLLQGNFDRSRIDSLGTGNIFIQVIARLRWLSGLLARSRLAFTASALKSVPS